MEKIDLSLIVTKTPEGVIGLNDDFPWQLTSNLHRFREITAKVGTVIVGRKTCDSFFRERGDLLSNKHCIVLSKEYPFPSNPFFEQVTSVKTACSAVTRQGGQACVIGGAEIYKLFMPLVRTVYITTVHATLEGDSYFPLNPPWEERYWNWRRVLDIPKRRAVRSDAHITSFMQLERIFEFEKD